VLHGGNLPPRQKSIEQPHKILVGFDIGNVSATGKELEVSSEKLSNAAGGFRRDDVVLALKQHCGDPQPREGGPEVVVVKTSPDFLLGAAGYPKWGELTCPVRIEEVGCHGQLEHALAVRRGILLPESTDPQGRALLLQRGCEIPLLKPAFELQPSFTPGRSRGNQSQTADPSRMLDRVQECEQATPGVANQGELLETPLSSQLLQITHVLPPADRRVARNRRSPATALIVVDQLATARQPIEARKEIIVMCPRSAMKDHRRWPTADPALEDARAAYFSTPGLCLLELHLG
jgi:hypothetical protein